MGLSSEPGCRAEPVWKVAGQEEKQLSSQLDQLSVPAEDAANQNASAGVEGGERNTSFGRRAGFCAGFNCESLL